MMGDTANVYAAIAWEMRPGVCMECGAEHAQGQPHNKNSVFYQSNFYEKNGRIPTWADAMAHCPDEIKAAWTKALEERGITV